MKNLIKLILLFSVFIITSCSSKEEREYHKKHWELARKTEEMQYLIKLNELRGEAKFDRNMYILDSLILESRKLNNLP